LQEGEKMAEQLEWNIYTATDAEVTALWRLVQEALTAFDLAEPEAKEAEVA
jgi:hypothetical protein